MIYWIKITGLPLQNLTLNAKLRFMALEAPMLPDFSGGPVAFVREAKNELLKVRFPSREETIKLTGIVIVISLIFGVYLGGLDLILTKITDILLSL